MKITNKINIDNITERRDMYTVEVESNVFAEVIYNKTEDLVFVAATADKDGNLIVLPVEEKVVTDFVKAEANKPYNPTAKKKKNKRK